MTSSTAPPPAIPQSRIDPVANFYIIYGLSFELLVKSLGDSSTSSIAQIALTTMQYLVRPAISGTTVFEGAFFDELCTVAYRIGMSEPVAVRKDMIEMMSEFAVSRKANSDAAQIRRVLAIITFALRGAIPSQQVPSTFTYSDNNPQRVEFLRTAFMAYGNVVDCVEVTQRADLYSVGIHLFVDILRDESANSVDVTGGCLSSLKLLLDGLFRSQVPGVPDGQAGRVVAGLVAACLGHVDDMR